MRKKLKKLMTFLLTGVMMFATLGLPVSAEGEEYEMFIAIGADLAEDGDWGLQYYGDGAASNAGDIVTSNAKVKVGDTVTIGLTMPSPVLKTYFVAPVLVAEGVGNLDYTIDSIKLDGEDVLADVNLAAGDAFWYEGTGDYTDKQAVRLAGGYNEWGTQYIAEPSGFTKVTYEITPNILLAPVEEVPQFEFDPNGTYHAYLGVQTPTWLFRNAWNDATYGRDVDGGAYFGEMGFAESDWQPQGGTFTDVEITGNGTYTVALNGFDFSGTFNDQPILGSDGTFNLLFVSTDLPRNDAVVISNVVLKMDGKEITTQETPFLDPDQKETQSILLANIWNSDITALPYYAAPTSSIEISFDVSGFANDAAPQEAPAEDAQEDQAQESDEGTAPADETAAPAEEGGSSLSPVVIVVIVVVVAAVVACAVVAVKKKKQ